MVLPAANRHRRRPRSLTIGVIGPGKVGSSLLDQVALRREWIRERLNVDLRVAAVANRRDMLLMNVAEDPSRWRSLFNDPQRRIGSDLGTLVHYLQGDPTDAPVIVDCTADEGIANSYGDWLEQGVHVVTPNKGAGSGDLDYYFELRRKAALSGACYLYETTVGAALPILGTLRDLVHAGDRIRRIEGVLSGSLSYVFAQFNRSERFSDLVLRAHELGFTEPDPRNDLSGIDVARKTVILGREIGLSVSLDDVQIQSLVPIRSMPQFGADFRTVLAQLDQAMADQMELASSRGQVLRLVGEVDPVEGSKVALQAFDTSHPFARTRPVDNIVQITSSWYDDNPLVIQGPGAGPGVTAGGILTDLLRVTDC